MAGFLAYALAGAATGAGEGMIAEAKAKREEAMEELRNSRLMEREDRADTRQTARDERLFAQQTQRDQSNRSRTLVQTGDGAGLLDSTTGDISRLKRDGEDYSGPVSTVGTRDYGEMPASVQRGVINDMENIWEKNGMDERALKRAIGAGRRNGFSNDMLENWAREVLEADGYDDIDGALRRVGLLDGGDGEDEAPAPDASAPSAGATGQQPTGAGTTQNPFQATTQAHVNWFRENARPGQVIMHNGQRYTKD
jgi:hypothetical protein